MRSTRCTRGKRIFETAPERSYLQRLEIGELQNVSFDARTRIALRVTGAILSVAAARGTTGSHLEHLQARDLAIRNLPLNLCRANRNALGSEMSGFVGLYAAPLACTRDYA